ncbi:MAG: hypothetical protein JO336_17840 [Acidobacteriia bacterium]|nr:hypothetical protein [Terriglobia bacterium]
MILQLNHLQGKAAAATQEVIETLYSLLAEGHIDSGEFARLRIQLDWLQYKKNFRHVVLVTEGVEPGAEPAPFMHIQIDTRQVVPGCLKPEMQCAMLQAKARSNAASKTSVSLFSRTEAQPSAPERLPLEEFKPFRSSIAWEFNRLYWHRLKEWEQILGKGYEQALPGGQSDANHPDAVADSVADFWTLLRDLESKQRLPAEIYILEIGVGTGQRYGLFLDRFQALDQQRGTNFYPKLRVLLGDYSLHSLDRSRAAVQKHIDLCSFMVLDATNPLKTLSFLRHKLLHVHLTNVYDNLPNDEVLRRDGKLYFIETRACLPMADVVRITQKYELPLEKTRTLVTRLLEGGPDYLGDYDRGMGFWMEIWAAMKLEERLVPFEELIDTAFPPGLDLPKLEEVLQEAPGDLRFHLSSGALESFYHTIPLLYPRGYLQVQDIFVTDFNEYRLGFHGPGKMDGSIVNWVNGVLLREVGERSGYDVHFAPFQYRKGSKTSILYTTLRE